MTRTLLAGLSALLLALAAGASAAEPPTPLLWRVGDGDRVVYLLGSFHMLRVDDYPLADSTGRAFDDAEQLLFELSPAELNDPGLGQRMQAAGQRDDGGSLQAALPPALWDQLQRHAAARGIDVARLQAMDGWFASLVLALFEMQRLGLDGGLGLDKHFVARAEAAGKPALGLETVDQQIALFEGMSPEQQVQSVRDILRETADLRTEIERMHALWRAGDAEGLYAATGAEMKREVPALYQRINAERNRAWLPRVKALLDAPGDDDTLVVVGAMHLLGEDGLVALLRAEGYAVERL